MLLTDLDKFLDDCFHAGVQIPEDLTVVLEDFNRDVPEEYRHLKDLEYNYRPDDDCVITIKIRPKDGN